MNKRSSQIFKNTDFLFLSKRFVREYLEIGAAETQWRSKPLIIGKELLKHSTEYGKINDYKKELIDILATLPQTTSDRIATLIQIHESRSS